MGWSLGGRRRFNIFPGCRLANIGIEQATIVRGLEPIDCRRNSTDECGIPNDGQHAEEREVAISDEVGCIKRRVFQ